MPSHRPATRPFGAFRAALALMVIPQHIGSPVLSGTAAVYAFFALSGFVIVEAADGTYRGRPAAFAINRALRIWPLFAFAVVVSIAAHSIAGDAQNLSGTTVLANLFSIIPGISPANIYMPYAWAIEVEIIFYGFVAAGIAWQMPWTILASLAFMAFLITGRPGIFAYIPFFAFGALCYLRAFRRATIAFAACVIMSAPLFRGNAPSAMSLFELVCHMVLLSALLLAIPVLASRSIKRSRVWDNRLGQLSYPAYLLQHPAIIIASLPVFAALPTAALAFFITIALSLISLPLIDGQISALRQNIRQSTSNIVGRTRGTHVGQGA
jgi:peptidoglycan/LPS O-acetylase OafA/YrhL